MLSSLLASAFVGSIGPIGASADGTTATCARIAHVGDSLTVQMRALLPGNYARHGWKDPVVSAFGGRGVAREIYGDITGLQAVAEIRSSGFEGCWVIALGTNDTAHVADDGAAADVVHQRRLDTIDSMMDLIGSSPVMWVDVHLVADDDRYSAAAAVDWNLALREEQPTYSNMSVFDWAPIAARHPSWMCADRIHDTWLGSIARARMVTDAAAAAFGRTTTAATPLVHVTAAAVDSSRADVASMAPVPPAPVTVTVTATTTVERDARRAPRAWLLRH